MNLHGSGASARESHGPGASALSAITALALTSGSLWYALSRRGPVYEEWLDACWAILIGEFLTTLLTAGALKVSATPQAGEVDAQLQSARDVSQRADNVLTPLVIAGIVLLGMVIYLLT